MLDFYHSDNFFDLILNQSEAISCVIIDYSSLFVAPVLDMSNNSCVDVPDNSDFLYFTLSLIFIYYEFANWNSQSWKWKINFVSNIDFFK